MKTLLLLLLLIPTITFSQSEPDTLMYCTLDDHLGLGGYDPISYFEQNEAILGSKDVTATYENVVYQFESEAHRTKFLLSPTKYLPAYGGWCSMTLAMGRATTPKYDNFLIEDGKLYLFERTLSVNGKELWLRDVKGNQKTASDNYEEYVTTGKIE